MDKIRIAFIINNLGQGGAEKQFYYLIKALNPEHFEKHVLLYAYQKDAFYNQIFELSEILVYKNYLKKKISVLKIIEALLYIRKKMRMNRYDLVVSTMFMNNLFVRMVASKNYKNKCIANVRTSLDSYSWLRILVEKQQIKNSFLVFNSEKAFLSFRLLVPEKFKSRLFLIHNGFDVPDIFKVRNQLTNNEIVLGCLGRLNIEKNIIQVVRVFQKIEKPLNIKKLILQGNHGDQYRQIIEEKTSENIEIRNKQTDIEPFFGSIRILIISSLFEGCPNVLFEALLRKKLCIISHGANSDNFIINGENGFVYDGSDEDLVDTLHKALAIMNTEMESEIVENGFAYAKENFSIERMIYSYEKIFLRVYEKNKGSN